MTYEEFIHNILQSRGRFGLEKEIYKERHHIIPSSIGGNNNKNNLIDLTAEEHFRAHWLLAQENPDNLSLQYALIFTTVANKDNPNRYKPTKKEKEYLLELNRKIVSLTHTGRVKCYHKDTHKIKSFKPDNIPDDYILGYPPEYVGPTKGRSMPQSQKDKLSKSKTGKYVGKHWYNNGKVEILDYTCPEGFVKGRLEFSEEAKKHISKGLSNRKPPSKETREKLSKSKIGKRCYNNGEITIRAYECPEGFVPGFIKKPKEKTKYYNNGKINILVKESDIIPEGFVPGMMKNENLQGRHWFTNGTENKWCKECPEGFYPGKSGNYNHNKDANGKFCKNK